jgi:hypothetical protein
MSIEQSDFSSDLKLTTLIVHNPHGWEEMNLRVHPQALVPLEQEIMLERALLG